MTTQPAPYNHILPDTLSPQDIAYLNRLHRALRCGVPGCECATGPMVHCPSHSHAEAPTLTVVWDERRKCLDFQCLACPPPRIKDALAKRGLAPEGEFYTAFGAQEAGLQPFYFFIQQPPDWLWPNRIPLGKLTLIAGYPSSGKTSIALDIAARVSRGAPAPDQPDAPFPSAPVVLALSTATPRPTSSPPSASSVPTCNASTSQTSSRPHTPSTTTRTIRPTTTRTARTTSRATTISMMSTTMTSSTCSTTTATR